MSYIGRQLNLPASTVQLTADGAITAGKPVIIKADGDVTLVGVAAADPPTKGSAVEFNTGTTEFIQAVYDSSAQKIVIAYRDGGNSNYGTAIVGTVSDTSISFGSETVFHSGSASSMALAYDTNAGKVVLAYRNSSNQGAAVVGTVSGTSISFGSSSVYDAYGDDKNAAIYDANAQKTVIAYKDGADNHGRARVATVSGTSISFGTEVAFESASISHLSGAYDANAQKVVLTYQDGGNSSYGTAIVGTVSGTDISFGTAVVFESADSRQTSATYDSDSQKIVIAYKDAGNSSYGTAVVGTVSGTSISFGTPAVFEDDGSVDLSLTSASYDSTIQRVAVAYKRGASGRINYGTVSGTSISFGTFFEFDTAVANNYTGSYYDTNAKRTVVTFQHDITGRGNAVVINGNGTSLTTENFIGFAENDCTDNGLATIQLGGSVNDKQTSLTAGQTYFVQGDGTIGLTADSPSVTAGTAVSATEILVKG